MILSSGTPKSFVSLLARNCEGTMTVFCHTQDPAGQKVFYALGQRAFMGRRNYVTSMGVRDYSLGPESMG